MTSKQPHFADIPAVWYTRVEGVLRHGHLLGSSGKLSMGYSGNGHPPTG